MNKSTNGPQRIDRPLAFVFVSIIVLGLGLVPAWWHFRSEPLWIEILVTGPLLVGGMALGYSLAVLDATKSGKK